MDKYTVTCFFENSSREVQFFKFTEGELQKVVQAKTKQTLFVNKDFRGTVVIVDMAKVSHIHASPTV